MKKRRSSRDSRWQKKFGEYLKELIEARGYSSIYDFWINSGIGDNISRSYLNYLVNGERDPKVSVIRDLAKALGVKPASLIDFE